MATRSLAGLGWSRHGAVETLQAWSRGPYLTCLVLAAALIGLAWPLIFQDRALTGIDVQLIFQPYRAYLGSSFAELRIPLWNPYNAMGVPFAANPLARVFYPLDWLFLPLAPETALTASTLVHIMLGGLGMWLFACRVLRVRASARLLAALVFALSGVMMARVAQPNFLVAVAWLPLAFLAAHESVGPRTVRWVPILGVVLALQFLGGHPQYTWMTLSALLLWMVFEAIRQRRAGWPVAAASNRARWGATAVFVGRRLTRGLAAWIAAAVLLAALAAVQLVPALRLWWLSARREGFEPEALFAHSLSGETAATGLFPLFQTIPPTAEIVGYVGFVASALAVVALAVGWRRGHTWFLAALTALAILFAFGDQAGIHDWYYDRVPGFGSFRATGRWLAISTFALAGLAAVGADGLARPASIRRRVLVALAVTAAFALAGWPVWSGHESLIGLFGESRTIWTAVGIPAAALALLAILVGRRLRVLLPVAVAVELAFAALPYDLSTGIPAEAYRQPNRLAEAIGADGLEGRVLSVADVGAGPYLLDPTRMRAAESRYQEALGPRVFARYADALANTEAGVPNTSLGARMPSADLYDGGMGITRQFVELQETVIPNASERLDYTLRMKLGAVPNPRTLNLLNVRYLVDDTQHDGVVEDVYVDMDLDLTLRPGDEPVRINLPQAFPTAAVMGFSFIHYGSELRDGTEAGRIRLVAADGTGEEFRLLVGEHTAEGDYDQIQGGPKPQHSLPGYTRRWRGNIRGYDSAFYFERKMADVVAIEVAAAPDQPAELHLRGLSLRGPDGSELPVPVRAGGQLQLLTADPVRPAAQEGLKIYRNDPVLPRAYVVREVIVAPGPDEALSALRSPQVDPRRQVVLQRDGPVPDGFAARLYDFAQWLGVLPPRYGHGALDAETYGALQAAASAEDGQRLTLGSGAPGGGAVEIVADRPEHVVVRTDLDEPGVLVLADSIYPDWTVRIDGRDAPILRANHNYRGVLVGAGEHRVEFSYEPADFRLGWIVSLTTAVLLVAVVAGLWLRRRGGPADG